MNGLSTIPRPALWLALIGYYLATSLGHLQISLWLVSPAATAFGPIKPADYLPAFVALCFAVAALGLGLQAWRGTRRAVTFAAWGLWLAAVVMVDRWLLVTVNEYAHYPQYALVAWLLAFLLDPQRRHFAFARVLFWTTLLGVVDELTQYLYLAAAYGDYLDFNDFLLNLLGAVAGLLLYYGFRAPARVAAPRQLWMRQPELRITLFALACVAALAAGDRMRITPPEAIAPGGIHQADGQPARLYLERKPGIMGSWQRARHRARYYVLDPWQGGTLLVLSGLLFTTLMRHRPAAVDTVR